MSLRATEARGGSTDFLNIGCLKSLLKEQLFCPGILRRSTATDCFYSCSLQPAKGRPMQSKQATKKRDGAKPAFNFRSTKKTKTTEVAEHPTSVAAADPVAAPAQTDVEVQQEEASAVVPLTGAPDSVSGSSTGAVAEISTGSGACAGSSIVVPPAAWSAEAYVQPAPVLTLPSSVTSCILGASFVSLEAKVQQLMEKLMQEMLRQAEQRAARCPEDAALVGVLQSTVSDFTVSMRQYFLTAATAIAPSPAKPSTGPSTTESLQRHEQSTAAMLATWAEREDAVAAAVLSKFSACTQLSSSLSSALDTVLLRTDDMNASLRQARTVVEEATVVCAQASRYTRERAFGAMSHVGDAKALVRGVVNPAALRARERLMPTIPEGGVMFPTTSSTTRGDAGDSTSSFMFSQSAYTDSQSSQSQLPSQSASQDDEPLFSQLSDISAVSPRGTPVAPASTRRPRRSSVKTPGTVLGTRKPRTKDAAPVPRTPLALLAPDIENQMGWDKTPAVIKKIRQGPVTRRQGAPLETVE